jgi:hypothetical protein
VRAAISRAAYAESESDTAERLLDELEERLDEDGLFDHFLAGPVEACIARIRAGLGLPRPDRANDPANDPGASAAACVQARAHPP